MKAIKEQSASERFRERRWIEWQRYAGIVDKILRRGYRSLTADELHALPGLHAEVQASLAAAREAVLDQSLLAYLESLARRGEIAVARDARSVWSGFGYFLAAEFPRAVRGMGWPLLIATALFALGGGIAWQICAADKLAFHDFVPLELAGFRGPESSTESLRQVLYEKSNHGNQELWFFASFLHLNNSRVAILALGLGLLLGLPTGLMLVHNGLILGAFGQLYVDRGLGVGFFGWILPHGVPEIFAIVLCGAGGLEIARGLLWPGSMTRMQSFEYAGRRAAMVGLGSFMLLFYASLIEGVFRQTVIDDGARYGLACAHAVLIAAWVFLGGRGEDEP